MAARFAATWSRFVRDERGVTAIEYAMIAALIGGVIAATVYNLGNVVLNNLWSRIANAF